MYYYMQFIKFGLGRAVRDASRMIQNKQLSREDGLELARKYDHEFPAFFLQDMLEYLQLSKEEFCEIVDKHRNSEIWNNEGGEWKLRHPLE